MPSDIEDMMIEHHALIDEFSKEIFPKINSKDIIYLMQMVIHRFHLKKKMR